MQTEISLRKPPTYPPIKEQDSDYYESKMQQFDEQTEKQMKGLKSARDTMKGTSIFVEDLNKNLGIDEIRSNEDKH